MHRHELSDSQFAHLDPFSARPPPPRQSRADLGCPTAPWSTGFYGSSTPERPGVIFRNPLVNGILSMSASNADDRMAPGPAFCRPGWINMTIKDVSYHDLWSSYGTIVRAARAAGGARHHNHHRPRLDEGLSTEVEDPQDHALGYSRGGFGLVQTWVTVELAVAHFGAAVISWIP